MNNTDRDALASYHLASPVLHRGRCLLCDGALGLFPVVTFRDGEAIAVCSRCADKGVTGQDVAAALARQRAEPRPADHKA